MQFPIEIFYAVFIGVAAYLVFRIVKYGGLRGAMYGSAISRTIGEIETGRFGGANQTLRVHRLENDRVVLELASRSFGSANVQGVPMEAEHIDALIKLLNEAQM